MTDNRTTERVDLSPRVREAIDELMREKDMADMAIWGGSLTPEQAIAATLGSGTFAIEQIKDAVLKNFHYDRLKPPLFDWQAIADELNAELGSETCEPNWVLQGKTQTQEFWRCECGNCGHEFGVETRESFPLKMTIGKVDVPNYCPNCGKRVSA